MIETKEPEPEIILIEDNKNNTCKIIEKYCVYFIALFFVTWIGVIIYIIQSKSRTSIIIYSFAF